MEKYEYKTIIRYGSDRDDDLLNVYGLKGWELVSVFGRATGNVHNSEFMYYFKRKLRE